MAAGYRRSAIELAKAAQEINDCMTWGHTSQGTNFWNLARNRIEAHAAHVRVVGKDGGMLAKESLTEHPQLKDSSKSAGSFLRVPDAKERLLKVADTVISMCSWSDTPEGADFWGAVHKALLTNSENKKPLTSVSNRRRMLVYAGTRHSEDTLSQ